MTVLHIVLFKFKASAEAERSRICDEMLALKTECLHATTKQPYIIQSSGGKDNSPEGMQGGLTHGFVVEFASTQDRDYYVAEDPAHAAFIHKNKEHLEEIRVVDFEKGVY